MLRLRQGGNAVNFIMEHEHLSYPEALRWLAKKYHIEIEEKEASPPRNWPNRNERESILVVTQYAARQFTENLFHGHEGYGALGLSYQGEGPSPTPSSASSRWAIAMSGATTSPKSSIAAGYKTEYLVSSGLTIDKEGQFRRSRDG